MHPFSSPLLSPSHNLARLSVSCWLIRIRCLLNLPYHELECLDNVLVVPSTGFSVSTLELVRKLLAFLRRDLTLLGSQILLVTDDNNGDPFRTLRGVSQVKLCEVRDSQGEVPNDSGFCLG
jgi:hypothetical protein